MIPHGSVPAPGEPDVTRRHDADIGCHSTIADHRPRSLYPLLHGAAWVPAGLSIRRFLRGHSRRTAALHLKLVDTKDPSIEVVASDDHLHLYFVTPDVMAAVEAVRQAGIRLVKEVHRTPWGTREFVVHDDQGHTLYFGEAS